MRLTFLVIVIGITACEFAKNRELSIDQRYLKLDTFYTLKEAFNDSICKIAVDSANRRLRKNKFELYVFNDPDSSATPIQLLRKKFKMQTIAFAREDFVFKFCYNDAMIAAFVDRHHFNPIDSVTKTYDSLLNLGLTQRNSEFPGGFKEYEKYMSCNLEYPEGENLVPPYPEVQVSFRISPSGDPDKIEITKSFSDIYDSAVLKLVRQMPRWSPGQGDYGEYQEDFHVWTCEFAPRAQKKYCR